MTSLPETPQGPDLDRLRNEIDELKNTPEEELISPVPTVERDELEPEPTEAVGSVDWNDPTPEDPTDG